MQRIILALGLVLATAFGMAWSQKLQPTTGVLLVSLTDGAGAACTSAAPCAIQSASGGAVTYVAAGTTTITSGGVSQTLWTAGALTGGGWITNPSTASEVLCVNVAGGAATTTATGAVFCLTAGQTLAVGKSTNAITVTAATTSHAFSAVGF